jgi:hypothetical protein
MRLWSFHPKYLDAKGLVALWREGLLARAVIRGQTKGYRHHPEVLRFLAHPAPLDAIDAYLSEVWAESCRRGYCFSQDKIRLLDCRQVESVVIDAERLHEEWVHLLAKLRRRSPLLYEELQGVELPEAHPLMRVA